MFRTIIARPASLLLRAAALAASVGLTATCIVGLDDVETGPGGGAGQGGDGGATTSSTGGGTTTSDGGAGGAGGGGGPTTGGGGATPTYEEAVLADGPVGYWRFGEPLGAATAIDIVNGFDGSYKLEGMGDDQPLGLPGLIQDPNDTAVGLDNCSHGNIRFGNVVGAFTPNAPFTLEVWIRPTMSDASARTIVDRFSDMGPEGYRLYHRLGEIHLQRCDAGTCTDAASASNPVVALSSFYVVATYTPGTGCISIDGEPLECTDMQGPVSSQNPTQFGVAIQGSCYVGVVDELAVYNKALDQDAIDRHYAIGSGASGG